jgi:hypothetical protein
MKSLRIVLVYVVLFIVVYGGLAAWILTLAGEPLGQSLAGLVRTLAGVVQVIPRP